MTRYLGALMLLTLAACDQTSPETNAPDREVDMGNGYTATARSVAPGTTIEQCIMSTASGGYDGEANCPNVDGDNAYPVDSADPFNVLSSPSCLCLSAGNPGTGWDVVTTTAEISDWDCDDSDADINPDATEECDGVDNDCDGTMDDGVTRTWYPDADADTFGDDSSSGTMSCDTTMAGYVENNTDCNDAVITINTAATELCDAMDVDEDCDGDSDDMDSSATGKSVTAYMDMDSDGFGDEDDVSGTMFCDMPAMGYSDNNEDCNDDMMTGMNINPDETESCNLIDDNCDDDTDEGVELMFYADSDGDSYGDATMTDMACSAPTGYVVDSTDCDDGEFLAHPGGMETCNGEDEDCDGVVDDGVTSTFYADADGDSYGNPSVTQSTCSASSGYVSNSGDCNDAEALAYTGAAEACDGVDNDCDAAVDEGVQTTFYLDSDSDGYGVSSTTSMACSTPSGYADVSTDCNDAAASIHPGASETCNSLDDDCDSSVDEGLATSVSYLDSDSDGYGDLANPHSAYCAVPSGYAASSTDCNDAVFAVNPGATDTANNGLDDNCDSTALDEICTIPTFSSTSVYYQLWLDNLDTSTDDANWAYPGSARGRADAEVCAQNVTITVDDEWKVNGVFSTSATSGTFYSTSASFYAYGNGDTYVNFDYITVMGEEVTVTKTSWGGGADGLFYVMEELPN